MREWLSGGVSPCQGEGRGFESRLALKREQVHPIGWTCSLLCTGPDSYSHRVNLGRTRWRLTRRHSCSSRGFLRSIMAAFIAICEAKRRCEEARGEKTSRA